jgi:preprotein translocase subunit SecG
MTILFLILVIIASVVLGLIVLVQNPKGGGLAGSFGGLSTNFMGVKQTTDVLEKGTWVFGGVIALLCLFSTFFFDGGSTNAQTRKALDAAAPGTTQPAGTPAPAPGNTVPLNPAQGQ